MIGRLKRLKVGEWELETYQEAQRVYQRGTVKAIEKGLRSEKKEDRLKVVKEDLPKLADALNVGHSVTDGVLSEAVRKLVNICEEVQDPDRWIDDWTFVSGTYGYNVWRTEMAVMARNGWIEISGNKVRITEKGRKRASSERNLPN